MSELQVEALEAIKSDGHNLRAGDRVTVEESIALRWCGAGWAEAVKHEIQTGERRVTRAVVAPAASAQAHKASEVSNG